MWGDDEGPYAGTHYRLAETICVPPPVQAGGPPVMIGGSGERKTLRLVARYADACNLFGSGPDEVAHKLDVLRGHCMNEGRDYDAITKTVLALGNPFGDRDAFLGQMAEYAKLGVTQVDLMPVGDPVSYAERVGAELVPALRDIG
jgi:hypothetical protein